jgi:hypothetical protein
MQSLAQKEMFSCRRYNNREVVDEENDSVQAYLSDQPTSNPQSLFIRAGGVAPYCRVVKYRILLECSKYFWYSTFVSAVYEVEDCLY